MVEIVLTEAVCALMTTMETTANIVTAHRAVHPPVGLARAAVHQVDPVPEVRLTETQFFGHHLTRAVATFLLP